MRSMSRRTFLRVGGAAVAGAAVRPRLHFVEGVANAAGTGTTLDATIVKGSLVRAGTHGSYFRLKSGPGEPHVLRQELARRTVRPPLRRSLLNFVHLTDIHLCDTQSPARVEFLDRYRDPGNAVCTATPLDACHRPQETMSLHVLEAMCRRIRKVGVSPVSGRPITFAMCTGDNVDNEQFNELRWFIDLMDGRKPVAANSGAPFYEGVQSAAWGDQEYWHPNAGIPDKYKRQWGFPDYPGLLEATVRPFVGTGVRMPWYQAFGNHDGLMQGNAPRNPVFNSLAVGPLKISGLPPGIDPCDSFEILRSSPQALLAGPIHPVTADANRRVVGRKQYIEEHFKTTGTPAGHGFTSENRATGTAYYVIDSHPRFRLIVLDTVNPGGYADGSIGTKQFKWLQARLAEVHSTYVSDKGDEVRTGNHDKLVMLFSHHGLRSLSNPAVIPDPLQPASVDLPRVMAPAIEKAIHRFPNVVAWVDGHTHNNIVEPRAGGTGGFWDIGTAAHVDYICQSRLVEVFDNGDGTLSITCTMIDHAAPAVPGGSDPVLNLASVHRELAANDFQFGFASKGPGTVQDRNVELVIRAPFRVR